jgi:hypothetical protein
MEVVSPVMVTVVALEHEFAATAVVPTVVVVSATPLLGAATKVHTDTPLVGVAQLRMGRLEVGPVDGS